MYNCWVILGKCPPRRLDSLQKICCLDWSFVYICNIMGYMLPKAVTLLLGEMSCRLLEALPFYMLYLLICFITLAGRKWVSTQRSPVGLAQFFAVHRSSRKFCQCQDARLWWFLKRWINYLMVHAPSQSELKDTWFSGNKCCQTQNLQ